LGRILSERSNLFESHWSNQWLTQNRVTVVPQKVDAIGKSKLVLGCLDSSLAEASAALVYLTERRQQQRSEQLRRVAADLTEEPLPPNFKPDLGLRLMKQGGAGTTFHFPSVPSKS